jgi:hypothetical protein
MGVEEGWPESDHTRTEGTVDSALTKASRNIRERITDTQVESSLLPIHGGVHSSPRLPDCA